MKLSVSSVFTEFECCSHVFVNIPFWLNDEVPEAISVMILLMFEQNFFSSNTVITDGFRKNIFVTSPPHFSKFP